MGGDGGDGCASVDSNKMMKPREDSLDRLGKENFSLKMRINLLEEFVRSVSEDKASRIDVDLQKKIIDLEIELMNLKRDLGEKQKLLSEAASAIDLVEKSYADKLGELARDNQLLMDQAAKETDGNIRPTNTALENLSLKSDASQLRKEKGVESLTGRESLQGKHIRESKCSRSRAKRTLTRALSDSQMGTKVHETNVSDLTQTASAHGCSNAQSDATVPIENHLQLKKEYEKGCLAIKSLISCVKDMSIENLSMRQEVNNTKMLYLHESRLRRCRENPDEEDETRSRNSIKAEENQFWWSVVSELVTNNISSPYS